MSVGEFINGMSVGEHLNFKRRWTMSTVSWAIAKLFQKCVACSTRA